MSDVKSLAAVEHAPLIGPGGGGSAAASSDAYAAAAAANLAASSDAYAAIAAATGSQRVSAALDVGAATAAAGGVAGGPAAAAPATAAAPAAAFVQALDPDSDEYRAIATRFLHDLRGTPPTASAAAAAAAPVADDGLRIDSIQRIVAPARWRAFVNQKGALLRAASQTGAVRRAQILYRQRLRAANPNSAAAAAAAGSDTKSPAAATATAAAAAAAAAAALPDPELVFADPVMEPVWYDDVVAAGAQGGGAATPTLPVAAATAAASATRSAGAGASAGGASYVAVPVTDAAASPSSSSSAAAAVASVPVAAAWPGYVSEYRVWHGTKPSNVASIVAHGLLRAWSMRNLPRTWHSSRTETGIWFAARALLSEAFTEPDVTGARYFFVARILVPHAPHPLCDTVVQHDNGALMGASFQVLANESMHTEYLVTVRGLPSNGSGPPAVRTQRRKVLVLLVVLAAVLVVIVVVPVLHTSGNA